MNIQLKKAQQSDIDFIVSAELTEREDAFIVPWTKEQHQTGILDEKLIYLMIQVEGRSIGFFVLAHDPDGISMEFKRIVITEKGQGHGQKAIMVMIKFVFSKFEKQRIWLDVFEDNKRGQHVYEKCGFIFSNKLPFQDRFLKVYDLFKDC